MEGVTAMLAVEIAILAAAAIFTGLDVSLALKAARCKKPEYFNIGYRPEYSTQFCRARLVGKVAWLDNKVLYLVEIHPEDAARACAWTVPKAELRRGHLLEKGRFYKYAIEEELYD